MPLIDVLFLHYGAPWLRGSERCLLEAVSRLDRSCYRAQVLCNQEILCEAVRQRGIGAERIALPEILIDGPEVRLEIAAFLRTTRRIVARARETGAAVLYANSGRAAQAAWLASRWLRLPRIAHLHAPFYRRYHWMWGLWDADLLVFASEETRRTSLAGRRIRGRTRVVPNGVDLERFRPVLAREEGPRIALGIEEDALVIGQIGSLIPRKGVDVLLEAFATLRQHRAAILVVAGDGPERPRLEEMARGLGIADSVRFTGEVAHPERLLQHVLDVCVLASREESLPLGLLESAACGRPSVCTAVGGNAEVVQEGVTGLVVPAGSREALAAALLRLSQDPPLRRRLGAAARACAEKRFGLDTFVAGVEEAVRSVLPASQRVG